MAESDPFAATEVEPSPPRERRPLPARIGKYRVDDVLGRGAMGTVYAAYDPGLDRQVALKVLHGDRTVDARERLLREARAMARLHHPNVVTVHEVGNDGEVDYIAMELVDGDTLDAWLRDRHLSRAERIAAFLEAGRGLAAAHAAGLVHRDFKPHNVLRARSGRVVVTDFGLARGGGRVSEPNLAVAESASGNADLSSTLTQSGALLGTPAYMAPEQYQSSVVGAAADQFAFCVALWEALAGHRPFEGPTLYERRIAIDRGPDPATRKGIPRRLRKVLTRGLAVDPDARWPSMNALLAALRPPVRALALAGVAVVVAAVLAGYLVARRGGASAQDCADDDDLAAYREARGKLASRGEAALTAVTSLDMLAAEHVRARAEACESPQSTLRSRRLACLDVVGDELALAAAVTAEVAMDLRDVDVVSAVGDPRACTAGPARVAPQRDARGIAVARFLAEELPQDRWPGEPAQAEPACTRATWLLARATQAAFDGDRNAELASAAETAERCGDDRLRAVIAVITAEFASANPFGLATAIKRARLAVERAGNDRVLALRLQLLDAVVLSLDGELDQAIANGLATIEGLAAMQASTATVIATTLVVELLRGRRATADHATSERLLRAAIPHAGPRSQFHLSWRLAMALWHQGKLDEAHRVAQVLDPGPVPDGITVRGRVIDGAGKPVANARVVAAGSLVGDARAISIAPDRQTRTAADGTFTLTGVGRGAVVAAEHGVLRSTPAMATDTALLRVEPTGTIVGKVIRSQNIGAIEIAAGPSVERARWSVLANVADDGTFRIDGVPRKAGTVTASWGQYMTASKKTVVGARPGPPVELVVASTGSDLAIVVRPAAEGRLAGAQVWAIQGRVAPATVRELMLLQGTRVRRWARSPDAKTRGPAVQADDLVAIIRGLPFGEITACAMALGDLDDAAYVARLNRHSSELELRCRSVVVVDERAEPVVLVVPPPKRLSR